MIDWNAEFEAIAAANAKAYDESNTPEKIAARKAKAEAEFQRGIELGWWDAEGNSLLEDEAEDEEE